MITVQRESSFAFVFLLDKVYVISVKYKLQSVNPVKRLVFDLTNIPFLKRLIGISRLTAKVLNDQNLFRESNLANWFPSYVQFFSCGHFLERAEAAR